MIEQGVHLRTLGLVQLHLNQLGLDMVARLIEESAMLEDLDVSYNDLIPRHFNALL